MICSSGSSGAAGAGSGSGGGRTVSAEELLRPVTGAGEGGGGGVRAGKDTLLRSYEVNFVQYSDLWNVCADFSQAASLNIYIISALLVCERLARSRSDSMLTHQKSGQTQLLRIESPKFRLSD